MSGGLGKFREDIIALLRQENIPAIAAFEPGGAQVAGGAHGQWCPWPE